jgi:class 3 adenylate cyclase
MNEKPYSILKNENGALTIRDKNGEIIPEDYENQRYCDFLTWQSQQGPSSGPDFFLDKPCFFFSDLERLAGHCKQHGLILFAVAPTQLATWNSGFTPAGTRLVKPEHCFYGLCKTVAANDEREEEKRGDIREKPVDIFVSANLWEWLNSNLTEETSDARKLSSLPITRTFVYIDVSDFTRSHPGHQALIVNSIQTVFKTKSVWNYGYGQNLCEKIEASLCIGDGYIYVFKEPVDGTFFAAYLARLIEELVATNCLPVGFHFRMGVHLGPVFCFWDQDREDWNYIGEGINGGNRVLEAIGKQTDDVVFISETVRRELMARNNNANPYPGILRCLHNRGRRADKHGNLRRVYELNHSDLIPRTEMPPTLKV